MSPKGGAYGSRKQRNEFRPHKHRANSFGPHPPQSLAATFNGSIERAQSTSPNSTLS